MSNYVNICLMKLIEQGRRGNVDTDDIKEKIQSFFDADTLTIVRSGLSSAECISGMSALLNELKIKLYTTLKDVEDIKL